MKLLEYKPCQFIPLNQFNTELTRLIAIPTIEASLSIDILLTSFKFSDNGAEIEPYRYPILVDQTGGMTR